ncbi:SRPBCC family protein [Phytopseudomonas dryadis]|uniref:SRPBCC family protein n=1 Tax=Phytopseudomonas dryadis TaxID=2487520 RepID=UPI001F60BCEB|nr:SRPBCC family protein [Pseudomonas dryadis]
MIRAEYQRTLAVPPTAVFSYLSDPSNDVHWQASCAEATLLDGSTSPGSRYRIRFNFLGRRMDFACRILDSHPHDLYRFEVAEGPFKYVGQYRFSTVGDGHTQLAWQFDVEPGRFFGILPVSLLRKVLISQVEKDLANLETLLLARQVGVVEGPSHA